MSSKRSIVSLRGREREPDVIALLAMAQIHRGAADAAGRGPLIALDYANSERLQLYGYEDGGRIVGLAGVEPSGDGAVIRDLAVVPGARMRGNGRAPIEFLRQYLAMTSLEGDTLAQAVAFYTRCGFDVRKDGSMPDGQTKYRFGWAIERKQ